MTATTPSSRTSDEYYHIYVSLVVVGGILMAIAQLPQIHKIVKTKGTQDVSYFYQCLYASGISMYCIYYGFYEVWELFIPCVFCLCCILFLISLKIYLEVIVPRKSVDGLFRRTDGNNVALLSGGDSCSSR